MLKWSPEPFAKEIAPVPTQITEAAEFEPTNAAVINAGAGSRQAGEFRREAGFSDTKSLMSSLTAKERAQVYELVELDVAEEYAAREKDLTAEFDARLAANEAESRAMIATWTGNLNTAVARELKEAAAAAARLAVQMAEKIVRQSVAVAPEVLARVVETTLYKIYADAPLTVRTNPLDAAWLSSQHELTERLRIACVSPLYQNSRIARRFHNHANIGRHSHSCQHTTKRVRPWANAIENLSADRIRRNS